MRKLLLLMGLSMLGVLLSMSVAWAEDTSDCPHWRATPDGWQCSSLPDVDGFRDILGPPPTATATASAVDSVSPSATSSATSSSTASASASAAGAAQYQYTSASALPGTGGVSPVTLLGIIPAILLVGGGLLSARLIRRS